MAWLPRSDQVGSLRRPDFLVEAREQFRAGTISREQLEDREDDAIRDALRRQQSTGIEVLTDGEFRRDAWQTGISDAVDGFEATYPKRKARLADGTTTTLEFHTKAIERRLRQLRRITVHEVEFLEANTDAPFKVTMPSPNAVLRGSYQPGVTDKAYPTRDDLRQDLVPIYQAEVAALVSEGVRYIQLDEGFTRYGVPGWREELQAEGLDPDDSLAADIATENAVYDCVNREQVIFGSHLCRGSRTTTRGEGGYDDVAERLFADLHVDRFLLEDDAGQLRPALLRFLPQSKTVVLGLVTSKSPELEDPSELRHQIEQAAQHCSLDQLAVSPQCGFGGSADNDFMPYDQQFSKLEAVANLARRIWAS
jgi:5-methyltetrahydropteroyltriglutamate--homocysteine methyltransferase